MEKTIEFEPGFDKRHPDPNKNYGVCGMHIRFVLKGDKGAVQFLIYTDWYPPNVQREYFDKFPPRYFDLKPMGADVGYHSLVPLYDRQEPMSGTCEYTDGKPCYYDGSGLAAMELVKEFLTDGVDAVWKKLEDVYTSILDPDQEQSGHSERT